jgi:hypothetical protein
VIDVDEDGPLFEKNSRILISGLSRVVLNMFVTAKKATISPVNDHPGSASTDLCHELS